MFGWFDKQHRWRLNVQPGCTIGFIAKRLREDLDYLDRLEAATGSDLAQQSARSDAAATASQQSGAVPVAPDATPADSQQAESDRADKAIPYCRSVWEQKGPVRAMGEPVKPSQYTARVRKI